MHPSERGLSASVQWAVLCPLLLLAFLGAVQSAVWLHARTVASEAAGAGADVAAAGGGAPAAEAAARRVAAVGDLRDVTVAVRAGGSDVEVVVAGRPVGIVDLGLPGVEARVLVPREPR